MAESADATDLKSVDREVVQVQILLPAPSAGMLSQRGHACTFHIAALSPARGVSAVETRGMRAHPDPDTSGRKRGPRPEGARERAQEATQEAAHKRLHTRDRAQETAHKRPHKAQQSRQGRARRPAFCPARRAEGRQRSAGLLPPAEDGGGPKCPPKAKSGERLIFCRFAGRSFCKPPQRRPQWADFWQLKGKNGGVWHRFGRHSAGGGKGGQAGILA